ncbi:MAG TPA: hypothetical protein VIN03_08740 [Roseateles sp.]
MKLTLLALLLCSAAAAVAAEGDEATIAYRQAEYRIKFAEGASPDGSMQWAYPVVLPVQAAAHRRLNAWLREQALQVFKQCELTQARDFRAMPDAQLVASLSAEPGFVDCALLQSVIGPREAFGRYVTFERHTEWLGQARPQHGVELLVFDLNRGVAVELATLFKPEALEVLNEALAELIAEDKSRPECSGRQFGWSQLSLRPPADVFITYPYNPREWAECGDGVESLSGPVVAGQLLHSERLRPLRRWVKQNP